MIDTLGGTSHFPQIERSDEVDTLVTRFALTPKGLTLT